MAKVKLPTQDEVEALQSDFVSELEMINKQEREGKASPKKNFLSSISEEILTALNAGTSYVGIKRAIKKIYSIDLSTQIIADFAHKELGVPKRKKSVSATAESTDRVFVSSDKIKEDMAIRKSSNGEVSL
jgi:ribosomal protein L30E